MTRLCPLANDRNLLESIGTPLSPRGLILACSHQLSGNSGAPKVYSYTPVLPSLKLRPHSSLSDLNFKVTPPRRGSTLPPPRLLQSEHNLSGIPKHEPTKRSKSFSMFYWYLGNRSMDQQFPYYSEISEWLRFQPLSILQLDPADRIVLFIAGL